MSQAQNSETPHLALPQKFVLGLGFLAMFFSTQGITILAVPFYQMTLGVDPFLLGLAMKVPVILASCFGPAIGQMSDRCQSRFGRRRPFLMVFPWLAGIVFGSIWMVPSDWQTSNQLIYFACLTMLYYLLTTCWTVPMKCLAYEASQDFHERTSVMAFVAYFFKFGALVYHWVFPLAKLSVFGGVLIGVRWVGWGIALICIGLFAMLPALLIKERHYEKEKFRQEMPLLASLKQVAKITNMQIMMALIVCQMTLGVYAASMDYYVLVYYMHNGDIGTGATWKGVLSTSYALAGIASVAVITVLSQKIGKKATLYVIYGLTVLGGLCKWFIYQPGHEWLLVLDAILCCSMWSAVGVLASSMIADLIDEDEVKNNIRREGIFASVQNWLIQISIATAIILSGLTLNLIGFDAQAGANQSESALTWMRVILVAGTCLAPILSALLLRKYDLNEAKYATIRATLDQKSTLEKQNSAQTQTQST
ncbi:sodium:melibiose symporter [Saccharobesus litoralis]|uniref:Sodium:melibiose symporter n=1 Tax=Saccharobesus litoralis TaxID=2172099 RepID=A0A2S0VMP1_9ALTE|nr:MFS transporter [Saccharobesus litoralis]AWB65491.1 sodium:melibiose symporter [Saccharobesus litoralis]